MRHRDRAALLIWPFISVNVVMRVAGEEDFISWEDYVAPLRPMVYAINIDNHLPELSARAVGLELLCNGLLAG